jgi:hypothetical protein
MNKVILVALFLGVVFSTVVPRTGPVESHVPLSFKVQLKDDPHTRWTPIIKAFQ